MIEKNMNKKEIWNRFLWVTRIYRRFLILEILYNFDSLYSVLLQQNADNSNCTETRRRFLFICIMCKHVCGSTFISIQVVMTWYHIQHHPFSTIKFRFPISLISHHAVFMELTCQHLILKKNEKVSKVIKYLIS